MATSETLVVSCPACAADVAAEVRHTYEYRTDPEDSTSATRFALALCPRCNAPFLSEQDRTYDDDFNDAWDSPRVLYPANTSALDASVPKPIAESYVEAHRCFRSAAPTAAAIMCRRTLEGLCAHFGETKGTLQKKLQGLQARGVIEKRLFDWAEALRLAGNDAAHDVTETTSREDAKDLLDFTRAILEYVFTFSAAFQRFKARRDARKGDTPPG